MYKSVRTIDKKVDKVYGWGGTSMELTLWDKGDTTPQHNTDIQLKENYKKFDYLYIKYDFPGGDNGCDQFISLKYLTGYTITQQRFNLDDTTQEPVFYEHSIDLSADGNSFKINHAIKYPQGATTFTIKRIVGVRL